MRRALPPAPSGYGASHLSERAVARRILAVQRPWLSACLVMTCTSILLRSKELEFAITLERYRGVVQFVKDTCQPPEGPVMVEKLMREEGLQWPECVTALHSALAVYLQRRDP